MDLKKCLIATPGISRSQKKTRAIPFRHPSAKAAESDVGDLVDANSAGSKSVNGERATESPTAAAAFRAKSKCLLLIETRVGPAGPVELIKELANDGFCIAGADVQFNARERRDKCKHAYAMFAVEVILH